MHYFKKIFILILLLVGGIISNAQIEPDTQNDSFRAMWIFNIANNVIWPNEDTITTYKIGIYTRSKTIYDELTNLSKNKKIKNKPVQIVQFVKLKQISYTHILYLGYDKSVDIGRVNELLTNKSTLLITDRIPETENYMVNILPFDQGSKRIEIDKTGIEAHNLKVTEDLLYHGGSEEELKDLYSQQRKELDKQRAEIEKKKEEVLELQKDMVKQRKLMEEQKQEISKQKERLFEMTNRLKQQEAVLTNNELKLSRQENLIASKQREVQQKIDELAEQEKIIQTTKDEIALKQEELKGLEVQIEAKTSELDTAEETIESQQDTIIYGAIFILVVLLFSLFLWQALRKNSKMNKELKKKNTEINKQKDRIEHQAKLLESTNKELEQLSIVAENAQNGVVIMDNTGNIMWINAGFTKMYGYTLQLLVNERDKNISNVSDNPQIEKYVNQCIENKENVTYEIQSTKRNGEKIWVKTTLTPIMNQTDEIEKIVAIDTDISEIKEAEHKITKQAEELKLSNQELEKLSIVVRETTNAVLITDPKGNLEWVNQAFTDTFGFTLEEFKEKVSSNIISHTSQPQVKQKIDLMIKTKKPVTYELLTSNKYGDKIWLQANVSPILDKENNIKKIVIVDADISAVKEAEQEIKQKNEELSMQKAELQAQKDLLEEVNGHIRDSINYALTIQKSILPVPEEIDPHFENFLIYQPRDIVSGDFYWFNHHIENTYFIAAVDCTGHGVPGAFMSLISSRMLDEIVIEQNIHEPKKILTQLNKMIINALSQETTKNRDGMDLALVKIIYNGDNYDICFAGAKRPLIYYKSKEEKLGQIKGNRRSIGGITSMLSRFEYEQELIQLKTYDIIYLSSDGMIDQNNFERKRFGSHRFLNIIEKNAKKPMQTQKIHLLEEFEKYKNDEMQRDDIIVWGLKLK